MFIEDKPENWFIRRAVHKGVVGVCTVKLASECGHAYCARLKIMHPFPSMAKPDWWASFIYIPTDRAYCCAAFEVESLEKAEERLLRSGVEYHKFIVPGTNAAQIFLYDPEGYDLASCSVYSCSLDQHILVKQDAILHVLLTICHLLNW